MTTVNGTPLPATDTNAELLALGAALNTPSDLADILALPTDAFEPGRNRTVHAALVAVTRQGLPATPQTVYAELDRNGHHDTGLFVFALYQNGVPGTGHHYAQLIAGAARSRDYLAAAQRLTQLATTDPGEERDAYVLDVAAGLFENLADTGTPDIQALKHDREVHAEIRRLRARGDAARAYAREQRGDHATPPVITLGNEFLAQPDPVTTYRIDRLWPTGGRVLLAAQYKAGKTTMMGNLIRSLVDAEPFLDHYHINRQARRVTLIDNELDPHMIRRWLREQHIARTDAFAVLPLRGHLSTFDLLDPHTRTHWATQLRDLNTDIVILDCLRPIMDALGLDENREAGRLLTAIDELLGEAHVPEAVIVHHMGHTGERSRGDSRLRDWPDVEWRLMREDLDDPASPRYFAAFGRDVDVPETALIYDTTNRHLAIGMGAGNRKDAEVSRYVEHVVTLLGTVDPQGEGLNQREVIRHCLETDTAPKHLVPKILASAHNRGLINTWTGARNASMYSLRVNNAD